MIGTLIITATLVSADWLLASSSLMSEYKEDVYYSNHNTTSSTEEDVSFSANGINYQKVEGSNNNSAPWGSKFTPLSYSSFPLTISKTVDIPVHTLFENITKYDKETGHEKWTDRDEFPAIFYIRTRRWDTNIVNFDRYTPD